MEFYWDSTVPLKSLSPQKNERCNTVPVLLSFGSSYRCGLTPAKQPLLPGKPCSSPLNRKPWERRGWRRGNRGMLPTSSEGSLPHFQLSRYPIFTIRKYTIGARSSRYTKGHRVMRPTRAINVLMASQLKMKAKKEPGSEQRNIIHREEGPMVRGDRSRYAK